MKRMFPDKVFDRPEQMEFISLRLTETGGKGLGTESSTRASQGAETPPTA
jgi:hypothetical protein